MLCCGFLCFFFITLLSLGTCVCTVFLEYKEEAEKLQTKTKVSLQKLNEVNSVIFFFFGCLVAVAGEFRVSFFEELSSI